MSRKINLGGCRGGMLASADDVLEALQNIPFPEGVCFEKPVASWRGDAAAQGIEGKVKFGFDKTLIILTDPVGRRVEFSIESAKAGRTSSKRTEASITEYFRKYFGAS